MQYLAKSSMRRRALGQAGWVEGLGEARSAEDDSLGACARHS